MSVTLDAEDVAQILFIFIPRILFIAHRAYLFTQHPGGMKNTNIPLVLPVQSTPED